MEKKAKLFGIIAIILAFIPKILTIVNNIVSDIRFEMFSNNNSVDYLISRYLTSVFGIILIVLLILGILLRKRILVIIYFIIQALSSVSGMLRFAVTYFLAHTPLTALTSISLTYLQNLFNDIFFIMLLLFAMNAIEKENYHIIKPNKKATIYGILATVFLGISDLFHLARVIYGNQYNENTANIITSYVAFAITLLAISLIIVAVIKKKKLFVSIYYIVLSIVSLGVGVSYVVTNITSGETTDGFGFYESINGAVTGIVIFIFNIMIINWAWLVKERPKKVKAPKPQPMQQVVYQPVVYQAIPVQQVQPVQVVQQPVQQAPVVQTVQAQPIQTQPVQQPQVQETPNQEVNEQPIEQPTE